MAMLTDLDVENILGYLQQQRENMAELLQRLALVESPSSDPHALCQILTILTAELKVAGMSVRHLPGSASGGLLYAREPLRSARFPCRSGRGHR